jgi:hypothetical protein
VVRADWATTENNASAILKRRRAAATMTFVSGPILTSGGSVRVLSKTDVLEGLYHTVWRKTLFVQN